MPPLKRRTKEKKERTEEDKAEIRARASTRKRSKEVAKTKEERDDEKAEEEAQPNEARKGAIKKRKYEESEEEEEPQNTDDDDEDHLEEEEENEEEKGELLNSLDMTETQKIAALMEELRRAQRSLKKKERNEEEREVEFEEMKERLSRRAASNVKVDNKLITMFTAPLDLDNINKVMLYVEHHNHQSALVDGPKMDVEALITNEKMSREIKFYLGQYEDHENFKGWDPIMLCERLKSTLTGRGNNGKAKMSILECFEALVASPAEVAMIPAATMKIVHEIEEVMAKVSPAEQTKWTADQQEQHVEALLKMFGNVDTNATANSFVHDIRKAGTPKDANALITRIETVCQALQKAYGDVEPYLSAVMGQTKEQRGQQGGQQKRLAQSGSVRDYEEDRRRMESEHHIYIMPREVRVETQ